MLVQKLFKQTHKNSTKKDFGYVPFLVVAILVASLGIRSYGWINDGSHTSLLTETTGMIKLSSIGEIPSNTPTEVILPKETFGTNPYLVGIYPEGSESFPANSVAIIFTKNNERIFEMDVLPNTKLEQVVRTYSTNQHDSVVIKTGTNGSFIRIRQDDVVCKHPRNKSQPSFCPFKTILLFERRNNLIRIANDSDHLTSGELLMIARSIE